MRATGPGQSALLLLDVVSVLEKEDIHYAVIGAMAASVHGAVRASADADVIVSIAVPRMRSLETLLKILNVQTELRFGDAADPIAALLAISDSYGNRVDLLSGLRGLEAESFSRSLKLPFQGASLRVIGLEDFLAMKAFAGGPVDLDDARRVMAFSANKINFQLLWRLTEGFGAEAVASLKMLGL